MGGHEARARHLARRGVTAGPLPLLRLVSVAVPVPFLDPLTYNVPESMPVPPVGARVRVPVGARTVTGCVVRHDAVVEEGTDIKDVAELAPRPEGRALFATALLEAVGASAADVTAGMSTEPATVSV